MQIRNINNINFKAVYGVFGSKNELKNFDKEIRKNLDDKSKIETYDATILYANNINSKGVLTTAAHQGKNVQIYITGKSDCKKLETTPWGTSSMTRYLSYVLDASKEIPSDFKEEFEKTAQEIE